MALLLPLLPEPPTDSLRRALHHFSTGSGGCSIHLNERALIQGAKGQDEIQVELWLAAAPESTV